MSKLNLDVPNNYELLEELSFSEKNITTSPIVLKHKKNNRDWLNQSINVHHSNVQKEINLIIEKKISFYKYGIKLHCRSFTEKPYFRFDSDGPSHRNNKERALSQQIITTPHFNTYDENGREYAYKSEVLRNENDAEAIVKNIDFGISHFFQETNIKLNGKEDFPKLICEEPELFETEPEVDPLNGIDFLD